MNLETATYLGLILAFLGLILAFLGVFIAIYFYKKSKIITEQIAEDINSMMPKTREQELKDIKKKLSKATNQQLVIYLMKFANLAIQAQNIGAVIGGDGGLQLGNTIVEYLKRTDKSVKKALKNQGRKK